MSIFGQPEYVHILLHSMPVIGLAVAVIGLLLGILFNSKGAVTIGLLLVALTAVSAFPVERSGKKAEDRVENALDREGRDWLYEHEERAETVIYVFYVTAFVAILALVTRPLFPGFAKGSMIASIVLAVLSIAAGSWIGFAGGRISHSEIRDTDPPVQAPPDDSGHTEQI